MAKRRPDRDPEPPVPHEAAAEGEPLEAARPGVRAASQASIALWQLEGLAGAIDGIAELVRDGAAALAKVDVRPPEIIGKQGNPDYRRDAETGHLIRAGRPVACDEARLVSWDDGFELGDDPRACRALTGRQIQRYINTAIANGREAAAALCTDTNCENYKTALLYQAWYCQHHVDQEGRHSSALRVNIQLALTCVRNPPPE